MSFGKRGDENAVTIRVPSTANLMVSSTDASLGSTWTDFLITRNQSLLNGFFNRVGVTEFVIDYCYPNINSLQLNNEFTIEWDNGAGSTTVTIPDGFYTVSDLIASIVSLVNASASAVAATFVLTATLVRQGYMSFTATLAAAPVTISIPAANNLIGARLFATLDVDALTQYTQLCPNIQPFPYLDFVSSQLTYNQDLKDSSTSEIVRDVLLRFYLAWDNPPSYDADGFPILMGYTPFCVRRIFSPPKQIKWDSTTPIGQLSFQVYDSNGELLEILPGVDETSYYMTLQVSEN